MTQPQARHVPVLFQEAMDFLSVRPGGTYVDCTLGLAGHAEGIVRQIGTRRAFDRISIAIPRRSSWQGRGWIGFAKSWAARRRKSSLIGEAFSRIAEHVKPASVDGLLADFGVSSLQFDEARRGFSFQADGPVDMRMDTRTGPTAGQVVNEMSERELANLIYEYGEERRSRTVARAIVRGRPVTSTAQLARIVASAAPPMKSADSPGHQDFSGAAYLR